MSKNALPLPDLTDDQKAVIEANWREDPRTLLKRLWPEEDFDTRSVHWKATRGYLASIGKDPQTTGKVGMTLTGEQELFITNSYKDASGPTELARAVFEKPDLNIGSPEVVAVQRFIRTIDPIYRKDDERVEDPDYKPPTTINLMIGRLNRYGIAKRTDGTLLNPATLNTVEKRQLSALLAYMCSPTFKAEADKFTKRIDREVFESVFLGNCWDKPDLTPEHLLQYIILASSFAQKNQADRMVRVLDERFATSLEDPAQRLSKTEVDALNATKDKATEHLKQINALIKTLSGDRSKLIAAKMNGSATLFPLVEAWKQEESRRKMLALAQRQKQEKLKAEVERFSTMDSMIAELWGIDPASIVQ